VRRRGVYHGHGNGEHAGADRGGCLPLRGHIRVRTSVTVEKPASSAAVFFDVLGGKERRVRPIETRTWSSLSVRRSSV